MFPNQQQPPQPQQPTPPNTGGAGGPVPQSPQSFPQPTPAQNPYSQQPQQLTPAPAPLPQQPGYGPQPTPTYAVDYLDQIAPPPPRAAFLSGGFGKAVIALGFIFVMAVSLIVAFGGQKKTADLENISIRTQNLQKIAKTNQKEIKNGKLLAINSNYQIWMASAVRDASDLLGKAGVQNTDLDKKMVAAEKEKSTELSTKFNDARLNANLDRVYAREMAYQADLLLTMYTQMSKKSAAKPIRDYAKQAVTNLTPIQKSFSEYDDKI